MSEAEFTEMCGKFKNTYLGTVAQLSSKDMGATLSEAQGINASMGLTDPTSVKHYGEICVGMGYRNDDAQMALAGALAMTAAGHAAYGEIVGHHLREGFGTTQSSTAAVTWYAGAMNALENGSAPVFAASTTPDRIMLIRNAMQIVEKRASLQVVPVNATWAQNN